MASRIRPIASRLERQRRLQSQGDLALPPFLRAQAALIGLGHTFPWDGVAAHHAASVGHQVPDRDVANTCRHDAGVLGIDLAERGIPREFAALDQNGRKRGGKRLRDGSELPVRLLGNRVDPPHHANAARDFVQASRRG